jgi:hypothetical protein
MKIDETIKISITRVENNLLDKWNENRIEGLMTEEEFYQLKYTMLITSKAIKLELVGE